MDCIQFDLHSWDYLETVNLGANDLHSQRAWLGVHRHSQLIVIRALPLIAFFFHIQVLFFQPTDPFSSEIPPSREKAIVSQPS